MKDRALTSKLPQYLEQLSQLARNVTETNFVQLQRVQAALTDQSRAGEISPAEYKALSSAAAVLRDEMQDALRA